MALDSAFIMGIFKFDHLDEIAIRKLRAPGHPHSDTHIAMATDSSVPDTLNYMGVSLVSTLDQPTISLCPEIHVHRCAL